nr:MAG TPA: hypothetical protein [Caudoviricetes sp.]DAQ90644.1 MAG TPA: hypothetical protein [Caudoviricetes sp.]
MLQSGGEVCKCSLSLSSRRVWIEINEPFGLCAFLLVAPCVGAWVERNRITSRTIAASSSLRRFFSCHYCRCVHRIS